MNFLKVLCGDISNIFRNRFIRVSVIAVTMIPLIYGGLYLAAFWDPYGKTENLPVAVVNLDKGGLMDDKKVNYGEDIVINLKENDDLAWKFVGTQKEAEDGLKGDKYYAMVVIPKDFSQRIIDVDKGKLDKPKLIFVANKKKNYVVGLISDKVAKALKEDISKSIMDNFTIKVFDNLYELRDGMEAAADGTSQIRDGVTDLKDNIPTMKDGINKLYDGSSTLADKTKDAFDGSNKLRDGLQTFNEKMPDLVDGVNKLYNGSSSLSKKINDASDGSKELRDGVTSLYDKMPELDGGVNQIYDGSGSIEDGLHELNDKMPKLIDGVSDLKDGAGEVKSGLKSALDGSTDLASGLGGLKNSIPDIQSAINEQLKNGINGHVPTMVGGLSTISQKSKDAGLSSNISDPLEVAAGILNGIYNSGNPDLSDMTALSGNLNKAYKDVDTAFNIIDGIVKQNPQLETQLKPLKDGIDSVRSGISQIEQGVNKSIKLVTGINDLSNGASKLNSGLSVLYDGSEKLYNGLDELHDESLNLQNGVESLYNGSQNLKQGISEFKGTVPELTNGIGTLSDGTRDLSDGLFKINEGSKTITEKLGELNQKVPDMQQGVQELYDGSTDLSDGLLKLWDGSTKLKDGMETLKDKMPDLEEGVNRLYEGIAQLNDELTEGASKLADNLVQSSKAMGEFMSDPINLKENPLYEVKTYGEGLTPYFISLALWVGALMMFFVITEKVDSGIKVGPASIVLGKYLSYCTVGVLQAIFISFTVIKLGLRPSNVAAYYLFNIFLSFVFIAVIQNFIFLLGDPGRLLAVILLVLQLTSSSGTFPGELLPKFFRTIGPFLPFTYSISALREINSGIDRVVLVKDIVILAAVLLVFLISSILLKRHSDNIKAKIEEKKIKIEVKDVEQLEGVSS